MSHNPRHCSTKTLGYLIFHIIHYWSLPTAIKISSDGYSGSCLV